MNNTADQLIDDIHGNITDITDAPFKKTIQSAVQSTTTIIGCLVNLATLVVLRKISRATLSRIYLFLLTSQTAIDFLICVCGTLISLQPPMWATGSVVFDTFICHVWHGQYSYWVLVITSTWNLVLIAYDRFLAICKPIAHKQFTMEKVHKVTVGLIIGAALGILGAVFQVRMEHGRCTNNHFIQGQMSRYFVTIHTVWTIGFAYLAPVMFVAIFYGKVQHTLVKRQGNPFLGESPMVSTAARRMLKTAVSVTLFFIFSLGFENIYYFLGNLGLVFYQKNSLLQMAGVWLGSLNSIINPFFYVIFLPAFRKSSMRIFFPCFSKWFNVRRSIDLKTSNQISNSLNDSRF